MNRDTSLIFEAYKKVDPNLCRFPIPPKFKIGDIVLIKKMMHHEHTGTGYNSSDWTLIPYSDVLGSIEEIKCYRNSDKLPPTYYYTVKVIDKRYPTLSEVYNGFVVTQYEMRKTKLTPEKTQSMVDILDV